MIKLRSILVATAAVAAISGSALAADLQPRNVEPVAPVAEGFNWTGFYVGANAGYGFGSDHNAQVTEFVPAGSIYTNQFGKISPKGGFGGAQAGYNYQFGTFVAGIETDIQGADITDTARGVDWFYLNSGDAFAVSTRARVNWFGTLRPRVGVAFDNFLLYATGGFAYGGVDTKQSVSKTDGYYAYNSKSDTRTGYALGGGLEYAFMPNWTVKGEYQYIDFGTKRLSGTEYLNGLPTELGTTTRARADFHTVRVGVNYKF